MGARRATAFGREREHPAPNNLDPTPPVHYIGPVAGFVLWFTGLSGSGKSTLTAMVASEVRRRGVHVETLDGDEIRRHLSKGLGFSREDRDANIRRIGFVAKLVARSGGCAIAAAISPYKEIRNELRRSIEHFCEVYTECPIEVLSERDPKGLYKKALAGEIKNFTGVDDPYQPPDAPEVHVLTDRETPEVSLHKILSKLEALGYIPPASGLPASSVGPSEDSQLVSPHGADLVDRVLRGDRALEARSRARSLPSIQLDARAHEDLLALATGIYSPLNGFMQNRDYLRVVRASRLERGLPWSVPVTLSAPEEREAELRGASEVALRDAAGNIAGVLSVQDVWRPDRSEEAAQVLGTQSADDPGVRALQQRGGIYVGGEIRCLEAPAGRWPAEVRDEFARLGWSSIAALPTEWLPLRAEEYLARVALELTDGLVVLPLSSERSGASLDLRTRCHRRVLEAYFAKARTRVVPCRLPVHATPARLAILRALVAKNYGASRVVLSDPDGTLLTRIRATLPESELGVAIQVSSPAVFSRPVDEFATLQTAPGGFAPPDLGELDAAVLSGTVTDSSQIRAEVLEEIRAAR